MLRRSCLPILAATLVLAAVPSAHAFDFGKHFGRGERGNGQMTTVNLDVADCHGLLLKCGLDIDISIGDHQQVGLTVDDNLVDLYDITADDGVLVVDAHDHPRPSKHARLAVTLRSLTDLAIEGAGDVSVRDYAGDALSIDVSGAGDISLDGEVGRLKVSVDGAGDIDARDLHARDATVEVNGAGDVKVFASERADVEVNGVGDVAVYGNPENFSKDVNGVGDVTRK